MKKSDLKDGMVTEDTKGIFRLVWGNALVGFNSEGGIPFSSVKEDLTHESNDFDNVMRVYQPSVNGMGGGDINFYKTRIIHYCDLIWERKEITEELTLEQICKELGRDIKIVKG